MLAKIQKELKVAKGQINTFGGYKYRSLEDINEAVKPILAAHGCSLTYTDEVVMIGDRYYVRATARLYCIDKVIGESVALAREEDAKKGMSPAQITGACSSYARKYAAGGLLCIDDTRDIDADTRGDDAPPTQPAPPPARTGNSGDIQAWMDICDNAARGDWQEYRAWYARNKAGIEHDCGADGAAEVKEYWTQEGLAMKAAEKNQAKGA